MGKYIILTIAICNIAFGQSRIPSLLVTDKLADTTFLYKTSVRTDSLFGHLYGTADSLGSNPWTSYLRSDVPDTFATLTGTNLKITNLYNSNDAPIRFVSESGPGYPFDFVMISGGLVPPGYFNAGTWGMDPNAGKNYYKYISGEGSANWGEIPYITYSGTTPVYSVLPDSVRLASSSLLLNHTIKPFPGDSFLLGSRPDTATTLVMTTAISDSFKLRDSLFAYRTAGGKRVGVLDSLYINGRVGIGTNAPTEILHIIRDNPKVVIEDNTGTRHAYLELRGGGDVWTFHSQDPGNLAIEEDGVDRLLMSRTNGAMVWYSGNVFLNEDGGSYDVRIEGDADTSLFFSDGSVDRIGIGTATPTSKLTVNGGVTADTLRGLKRVVAGTAYMDSAKSIARADTMKPKAIVMDSTADTSAARAGLIEYNGKRFWATPSNATRGRLPIYFPMEPLYDSLLNTDTASVVCSLFVKANSINTLDVCRFRLVGRMSTANAVDVLTIAFYSGADSLIAISTAPKNVTNTPVDIEVILITRTIGAGGTVSCFAKAEIDNLGASAASLGTATFNTTTANTIKVRTTWSSANAGNKFVPLPPYAIW